MSSRTFGRQCRAASDLFAYLNLLTLPNLDIEDLRVLAHDVILVTVDRRDLFEASRLEVTHNRKLGWWEGSQPKGEGEGLREKNSARNETSRCRSREGIDA